MKFYRRNSIEEILSKLYEPHPPGRKLRPHGAPPARPKSALPRTSPARPAGEKCAAAKAFNGRLGERTGGRAAGASPFRTKTGIADNQLKLVHGTLSCLQDYIGYVKILPRCQHICPHSYPTKPPAAVIYIFASFLEVQLGRHGGDKRGKDENQSDGAENHQQHGLDLGHFEVPKLRFSIKCFVSIFRIMLLSAAGSRFSEIS